MIPAKTTSLKYGTASLHELIDEVLNKEYVLLFESLVELSTTLTLLNLEKRNIELTAVPLKIYSELDSMYRKEKFVVFPYIKKLSAENKKSPSCAPFKKLKVHASAILMLLRNIKQLIVGSNEENECNELIKDFELKMIRMQKRKEQYIFKGVRSCEGCRLT